MQSLYMGVSQTERGFPLDTNQKGSNMLSKYPMGVFGFCGRLFVYGY